MAKEYQRNIATSRQLNFTLSPVDTHNEKKMPYDLATYSINGTWNQHQSIILDLLLDRLLKGFYAQYRDFPKSWRSRKVLDTRKRLEDKFTSVDQIMLAYLSKNVFEAFKMRSSYDIKERASENYAHFVKNGGNTPFDQYLQSFTESNRDYQNFLQEMDISARKFYDNFTPQLTVSDLFKAYPILSHYKGTLHDHISKISNTKFKLNYKVKHIDVRPAYDEKGVLTDRGKLSDTYYKMCDFEEIFLAEFEGDLITLNFKSPLGKLIVMNTLILDTDWISEQVFTLPKNAYFIYKRFILNRVSGKNKPKELQLWFDDIKNFLDLKWDNNRGIHQIIDKALTAVKEKGLIAGYTSNKNHVKQRQYCLSF